ncbi:MAG: hypothetical protein ACYDBT_15840 [Desulfobulbaceae bacterium]
MKAKLIIFTLFFGLSGLACIFMAIWTFITGEGFHGQSMIWLDTNNFFLKYSISFMFFFLAIPSLAFAILPFQNILVFPYHDASKYDKAKNDLIIQTLMFPLIFLFALILRNVEIINKGKFALVLLAGFIFMYRYIESILIIRKEKKT